MNKNKEEYKYYHHKNLKEALILKVLETLETDTLASVKVRTITDKLGTSRTAIYRHFSSKAHLLKAVILKAFAQLEEEIIPISIDEEKNIKIKFYEIGKIYIEFAMASPARYRLMFGNQLTKPYEEYFDVQNKSFNNILSILMTLSDMAQKTKLFLPQNSQKQAVFFLAMLHGQASLFLDGHSMIKEHRERIYEMSFNVLIEGLRG